MKKKRKNKKNFKIMLDSLLIVFSIVLLFFLLSSIKPTIMGFVISNISNSLSEKNILFVTKKENIKEDELPLYLLLKEIYALNISKIPIQKITDVNISQYHLIIFSVDTGKFLTDEICELIANSKTSFVYSDGIFNSKCTNKLILTTSSSYVFYDSQWNIVNNSFYPTSHLQIPKKIKIFINAHETYMLKTHRPEQITLEKENEYSRFVLFQDNLQKRAFFALPRKKYDFTMEGKEIFGRLIIWLVY